MPQKAGVILYGLLVGASMVPITALGGLVLGFVIGIAQSYLGVHGEGAWTLIAGLELGIYLGIPVGLFVCLKVCRSRLREPRAES
jgi:hypothetical protein